MPQAKQIYKCLLNCRLINFLIKRLRDCFKIILYNHLDMLKQVQHDGIIFLSQSLFIFNALNQKRKPTLVNFSIFD